jgi:hypothetical protein
MDLPGVAVRGWARVGTPLRYVWLLADELKAGLTLPGVVVLALLLVAVLASGFLIDLRGFAVNLLAGFVGLIVAIVGGVVVIDRLPDRRRQRAWQQIRGHTLEMLQTHVTSFAGSCALATNEAVPEDLIHYDLAARSRWLHQLAGHIRTVAHLDLAAHEAILAAARNDLAEAIGPATHVVVSHSSDSALVDLLQALARAANQTQLLLLGQPRQLAGASGLDVTRATANTLDAGAAVFDHLSRKHEPPPAEISTQKRHRT